MTATHKRAQRSRLKKSPRSECGVTGASLRSHLLVLRARIGGRTHGVALALLNARDRARHARVDDGVDVDVARFQNIDLKDARSALDASPIEARVRVARACE